MAMGTRKLSGEVPAVKFAQARGGRIAYQDFGEGPVVVAIPPMAQNIEVAWEWPGLRRMLERFGSFSRWIQFDKRGTGASDRRSIPGLDERVEGLRAVMDHAGVERAFLYGASEGGPMCVLFAATYPERVLGLILHGTTASYRRASDPEPEREAAKARRIALAAYWGTPDSPIAKIFAPSLAVDPEFCAWMQRYERVAADQDSLRDLLEQMGDFDVTDLLADLEVPTLVMHREGDLVIPVEAGRELAAAIPDAQLIEHAGNDHFGFAGDQGWLEDLERFVTGTVLTRPSAEKTHQVVIRTLGRFFVEVNGAEVPTAAWKSRLPRELCKRLVAARGWPITRDELFDSLWPDEHDRAKLSSRLSVHLSAVRRILGGGVIADRQTIALDFDAVSTDLELFFRADSDEQIVERYTGTFLPEDAFEDWTQGIRDEALHRFKRSASLVASTALAEDDNERAADLARRLIDADRYDERGHATLVAALRADGDITLARTAHDAWASALGEIDIQVPPFGGAV